MKVKGYLILAIVALLVLLILKFSPAQQQEMSSVQPPPPAEAEVQWVWGEVVSADAASNSLSVKYLDYETDTEKEMTIVSDSQTTYENIKGVAELKPKDNVSIDYIVSPAGRNIAKNISLEKPETTTAVSLESENVTVAPAVNNTTAVPAVTQ